VTEEAGAGTSDPELVRYGQALARELELTLSTVRGAGKVCVQVALRSGPETELAANNVSTTRQTQETDATGTSRQTSEHTQDYRPVMSRTAGGLEAPVVTAVRPPAIEGVLVVAEGALDSRVRAELTRAVATLLQLPVYRIRVLPMKGGE
jgi:stage III sporulation protein AG